MDLNAYFVSAGIIPARGPEIEFRLCDIVLAENRGQARYFLWQPNKRDLDSLYEVKWEWTRLVAKGISGQPGLLTEKHPQYGALWELAERKRLGSDPS